MCIIDCLSTIVFILPLYLDDTKVIILILWRRTFQLEYWRTFQLVSTVEGLDGIKYTYNNGYIAKDPKLAVMNFINALERIPAMIEKREQENAELSKDIPVLQEIVAASWPKDAEIKRLNEELATLNRKIQLTIKPAGGHESGTDDGTEMKGQKETGESDDTPDLPRKARHVPSMEIAVPSNGLKKIS